MPGGTYPLCPSLIPTPRRCAITCGGWGTYWLEFGIDGWRLDVPEEIDDDAFWQEFRRRCREVNPECYIVGEIWQDATRWLQGDQFDAVMNYPFTRAAFGFVAQTINQPEVAKSGYKHIPKLDAPAFAKEVEEQVLKHDKAINDAQLNLLGSHDTPRALTVVEEDESALYLALLLLFGFPGAPCIYYGDELGLTGGHDPYCRQAMPWDDKASWNQAIFGATRQLVQVRHAHKALRRGTFETLHAAEGVFVFLREWEGERVVGVVNSSEQTAEVEVALKAPAQSCHNLLGDRPASVTEGRSG